MGNYWTDLVEKEESDLNYFKKNIEKPLPSFEAEKEDIWHASILPTDKQYGKTIEIGSVSVKAHKEFWAPIVVSLTETASHPLVDLYRWMQLGSASLIILSNKKEVWTLFDAFVDSSKFNKIKINKARLSISLHCEKANHAIIENGTRRLTSILERDIFEDGDKRLNSILEEFESPETYNYNSWRALAEKGEGFQCKCNVPLKNPYRNITTCTSLSLSPYDKFFAHWKTLIEEKNESLARK